MPRRYPDDPPQEPRIHLALVRDGPRAPWPKAFASDICDELCTAVDDALSVRDALRALLRTLCDRMRWNAGRGAHADTAPVWHVDTLDTVRELQRILPPREVVWEEPWTVAQQGGFWSVAFPIDWSAGAHLALFATEYTAVRSEALDDIARALVPAGALLWQKRGR